MDLYISKYVAGYLIKYASISLLLSLMWLLLYLFLFKTKTIRFQFRNLVKKSIVLDEYGIPETRIFRLIFHCTQYSLFILIFALVFFFIQLAVTI